MHVCVHHKYDDDTRRQGGDGKHANQHVSLHAAMVISINIMTSWFDLARVVKCLLLLATLFEAATVWVRR